MQLGEQGRYAEALDAITHAIEIDPSKSRVQYNYAKLLLDRGERAGFGPDDLADAYAHFREAARLTPGWALPEVGMGLVLLREHRTLEAARQLEHSLALEPENIDALLAIGLLESQRGAPGEAQKFFARAVELDAQRPEAHYGLGQVLAEQGNLRGAVEQLAEAVRLRPVNAAAWSNRGALHARLGEVDAAVECFEQAARLEPDSPQAQENLAKVRQWQQQMTRP
jgi:tetratricopeptide (TPR) repeat protein